MEVVAVDLRSGHPEGGHAQERQVAAFHRLSQVVEPWQGGLIAAFLAVPFVRAKQSPRRDCVSGTLVSKNNDADPH